MYLSERSQQPAINTLKEVETFLSQNPSEVVTIIIEDYVHTPKGLTNLFTNAGLDKYWFPVSKMPRKGEDWPTVTDMVQENHRLLVFTSIASKEADEGIAYQWRYMVENECKYYRNLVRFYLFLFLLMQRSMLYVMVFSWRWWGGTRIMPKQKGITAAQFEKCISFSTEFLPIISS